MMLNIREFAEADWVGTWNIIEPVFRAGRTYPFSLDITERETYTIWVENPSKTYVVVDKNQTIVGTYYLKPNHPCLAALVCNCGYIVSEAARGLGVGSAM